MKLKNLFLVAFVLIYLTNIFTACAKETDFSLEVFVDKMEIKIGEVIKVGYTIRNTTDQPLSLRKEDLFIHIYNEKGSNLIRYPNDMIEYSPDYIMWFQNKRLFNGLLFIEPRQSYSEFIEFSFKEQTLQFQNETIKCFDLLGPDFYFIINDSNHFMVQAVCVLVREEESEKGIKKEKVKIESPFVKIKIN